MYNEIIDNIFDGGVHNILITMSYKEKPIGEFWITEDECTYFDGNLHVSIGEDGDLYIPMDETTNIIKSTNNEYILTVDDFEIVLNI